MTGIEAIAAERRRQIEQEGWTAEHDDQHGPGDLAGAGSAYPMSAAASLLSGLTAPIPEPPPFFPFEAEDWKPRDPRSDLVRAGALIAAEIDRLDRLAGQTPEPPKGH
jgi:hypothetical protein